MIDLTQALTDLDGNQIKDGAKDLTLGRALAGALCAPVEGKKFKPSEVADRYGLAIELNRNDEMDLSSEQIVSCKEAVCAVYNPLVSGQVCLMLK